MKVRMTISVEDHLARKIGELARRSGLSNSGILNICLRFALPKLESGNLLEPIADVSPSRKSLSVLIVEDSDSDAELLLRALKRLDYDPAAQVVKTAEEMQEALTARGWDLVLADWVLPDFSGLEALQLHKRQGRNSPFIIVSGRIGEEAAVEAMRSGADDYVLKDRWETLGPAVERALAKRARSSTTSNNAV